MPSYYSMIGYPFTISAQSRSDPLFRLEKLIPPIGSLIYTLIQNTRISKEAHSTIYNIITNFNYLSAVASVSSSRVRRQSIAFQHCQSLSHLHIFYQQLSDPRMQLRDRPPSFIIGTSQAARMGTFYNVSMGGLRYNWRCGGGGGTTD
jgi:hypothetical protein